MSTGLETTASAAGEAPAQADGGSAGRWERIYEKRYPELGTAPLPLARYISPEYFELEREHIFKKSWMLVGRVDEIPAPNDYFVQEIEAVPASIIVARGRDNEVRAFHNVCSHRGNRICVDTGAGNAKRFVCRYHSWNYDSSGRLVGVPGESLFADFDKAANGLTPVICEVWEGFIFINLDRSPETSLPEFLGDLYEGYDGFFSGYECMGGYSATTACNWKAVQDAFLEVYHFPSIHRNSIPDIVVGKGDPPGHILDARFTEQHRVISTSASPFHKPTPTELLAWKYGQGFHSGVSAASKPLPPNINQSGAENWNGDIVSIFPNFWMQALADWCLALWFWPVDQRTTRLVARFYMPTPETAGQRLSNQYTVARIRETLREDLSNLENHQRGMESGGKTHMLLQDREIAIRHCYQTVERAIGK